MNAAVAPLPRLRALHARDLPALMRIENEAYEFPWTEGIFRDCLSAGYECWCSRTVERCSAMAC